MLLHCGVGEDSGTPLQYSCLENPMGGGAWWVAIHGVTKSRTQLSTHKHTISLEETKSSLVHMVAENTMLYSVKLKLELHWLLLPPFHISESVVTCILRLPSCFVLFLS